MNNSAIASILFALLLAFTDACGGDPANSSGTDLVEDHNAVVPDSNSTIDGTATDLSADSNPDTTSTDITTEDQSGFNYPCEPGSEGSCVTSCGSAGWHRCLKEWGPCIPPEEFCGNCVDDDCDGLVNEECLAEPEECGLTPELDCPSAVITIEEENTVFVGNTVHLSAADSVAPAGASVTKWKWTLQRPAGSTAQFAPSDSVEEVTLILDVAGQYLVTLVVWDSNDTESCSPANQAVTAQPFPPVTPEVGCADGEREGFLSQDTYPQIAACAGAWTEPGITPDAIVATCGHQSGDDSTNKEGTGCASPDLCAPGWHICIGWQEVAAKSPDGCVGATPPDAKSKSLFFAVRQPSENGSVCGDWGDGFNDVFGCGNLGSGLGPDKNCGPLDRVIASTQPNTCGFNEAEPTLGPWECMPTGQSQYEPSHLNEGALVTKKGCPNNGCSYDGYPVASFDKGGVVCCHD